MPSPLTEAELQQSLTEQQAIASDLARREAELQCRISDAKKPIEQYDCLAEQYDALHNKHNSLIATLKGDISKLELFFCPTKLDTHDDLTLTLRTDREIYSTHPTVASAGDNPFIWPDPDVQEAYDAEDLAGKAQHVAEENTETRRHLAKLKTKLMELEGDERSKPAALAALNTKYDVLKTAHLELTKKLTQAVKIDLSVIKAIAATLPREPSSSRFFREGASASAAPSSAPAPQ